MSKEELEILQSGYELTSSYINDLRGILKKLNLKEMYNFEKWRK